MNTIIRFVTAHFLLVQSLREGYSYYLHLLVEFTVNTEVINSLCLYQVALPFVVRLCKNVMDCHI